MTFLVLYASSTDKILSGILVGETGRGGGTMKLGHKIQLGLITRC